MNCKLLLYSLARYIFEQNTLYSEVSKNNQMWYGQIFFWLIWSSIIQVWRVIWKRDWNKKNGVTVVAALVSSVSWTRSGWRAVIATAIWYLYTIFVWKIIIYPPPFPSEPFCPGPIMSKILVLIEIMVSNE